MIQNSSFSTKIIGIFLLFSRKNKSYRYTCIFLLSQKNNKKKKKNMLGVLIRNASSDFSYFSRKCMLCVLIRSTLSDKMIRYFFQTFFLNFSFLQENMLWVFIEVPH